MSLFVCRWNLFIYLCHPPYCFCFLRWQWIDPVCQSEAMLENIQGPRPKPKQIPWLLWWRNEYPWNHHTHPLSQICVGNLKTQDIRNDYALGDLPGKLGVVNNEKHTIEAKILDCSCGWFLLEFWNLCINRNRQKLYTIHVTFCNYFPQYEHSEVT